MELTCSVERAAELFGVTPKAIRSWIRDEGFPVLRRGTKGPGRSSVVDLSRAESWMRRRNGDHPTVFGRLATSAGGPAENPFRDLLELAHRRTLAAAGIVILKWLREDAGARHDWQAIGLTVDQAQRVAGAFWLLFAFTTTTYLTESFDNDLAKLLGNEVGPDPQQHDLLAGDDDSRVSMLDLFASLALEAHVRSTWTIDSVEMPEEIAALIQPKPAPAGAPKIDPKKPRRGRSGG